MPIETGSKTPEEEINKLVTVNEKSWTNVVKGGSSNQRLSWAGEVEAMDKMEKKSSIWDNFDVGKISNVGFKLDYVSPMKQGESAVCEVEIEEISSEINYWKTAVVCYVLKWLHSASVG